MEKLLGYLIPIAFGAAISPTLLAMTLAILSNPKSPKTGIWVFLIGAAAVVIIIGIIALLFSGVIAGKGNGESSKGSAFFDIGIGILLFVIGLRQLLRKSTPKASLSSNSVAADRYFVLGIILMATNLSTLVLYFSILKDLVITDILFVSKLAILVLVVFIILLPITVPLALSLLFPKSFNKILAPLNAFLQKNSKYVMSLIIFFFGVLLILKGYKEMP